MVRAREQRILCILWACEIGGNKQFLSHNVKLGSLVPELPCIKEFAVTKKKVTSKWDEKEGSLAEENRGNLTYQATSLRACP